MWQVASELKNQEYLREESEALNKSPVTPILQYGTT